MSLQGPRNISGHPSPMEVSPSDQSRFQSPRHPCLAERKNDLWDNVFQLDISLAKHRAHAVVSEVRKH